MKKKTDESQYKYKNQWNFIDIVHVSCDKILPFIFSMMNLLHTTLKVYCQERLNYVG